MSEDRTLALAGIFQASTLVDQLAQRGHCDQVARDLSLRTVLRIDADSAADIFDRGRGLTLGLSTVCEQLDQGDRNMAVMRYALQLMQLEGTLRRRKAVQVTLGNGIAELGQFGDLETMDADLIARLGDLYTQTISKLTPRIIVHGSREHLERPEAANQIRALLLAGVRSAVLWRQLRGGRIHLILNRRKYVNAATAMRKELLRGGGF